MILVLIKFLFLIALLVPCAFSEPPPYTPRGFRPSQPFPLPGQIQSPIPAKQYGPPKPEYGVPSKPDDTREPTTPPNDSRGVPMKFHNINYELVGQSLPFTTDRGNDFYPSMKQQNSFTYQQRLPEFGNKIFKQQQNTQGLPSHSNFQTQALPQPISAYTFDKQRISSQGDIKPHNFHAFSNTPNGRRPNVEIQKSQQINVNRLKTQSPSTENQNINFNNQNSIDFNQNAFLNVFGNPQQKPKETERKQVQNQNIRSGQISDPDSQVEVLDRTQFSNTAILASKRASAPRRGGKVTTAPVRQYLQPTSTTVRATLRRRRPPATEATETESNDVTRGPNFSVANAFAGRLFLLQPDGRLEPVLLRRAIPNGIDPSYNKNISPAELTQPLYSSVELLNFK